MVINPNDVNSDDVTWFYTAVKRNVVKHFPEAVINLKI